MSALPKTAREAKALGVKKYFTGKPCGRGHIAPRWASILSCTACLAEYNKSPEGRANRRKYERTSPVFKARYWSTAAIAARKARETARVGSRVKNPDAHYARRYGLTRPQVDAMIKAQDNRCAICRCEFVPHTHKARSPSVDHCHETGKVRGILCSNCNHGIGKLKDSPAFLRAAIVYLEK